jgi:hypothetical protein
MREEVGLKGLGLEEIKGGMRRRRVEKAQGLPQKSRSSFPLSDRIKATCLDENTHILEMNVTGCAKEKLVEAGKGPVFGSFADNELDSLL